MSLFPAIEPAGEPQRLRSGRPVWDLMGDTPAPASPALRHTGLIETDIAIVGAGITGALLAERLSRTGRDVAVIDRHAPARGSTAASTALILWEIDTPLVELESRIGFETAAQVYRQSHAAVSALAALTAALAIPCDLRPVPSLYLSGNRLDPAQLQDEHRIRRRAGLPGDYLPAGALPVQCGLSTAAAALQSPGGFELDPVRLTRGLMQCAIRRGVKLLTPLRAVEYEFGAESVTVHCDNGLVLRAGQLVLATGYELPPFVRATARHSVLSTWAMATPPQPERRLPAIIWEAADPYLYLRSTADGRLVIGGEDAEVADADARDALAPAKTATLQQRLAGLLPGADTRIATAWSGRFGMTADGLPLIGPVPDYPRCFAAYGYGGNGITFGMMAAELLAGLLAGGPAMPAFALDR